MSQMTRSQFGSGIRGKTILQAWFPMAGSTWGLVGGIGGSILGICGAIFGTWMTVERAKISEVRARLDATDASAAG